MQITRPQLPLTGPISRADLQGLNDIGVALDDTDKAAMLAYAQAQLGNGIVGKNYLLNAAFDLWTRGTAFIACPLSTRTVRADDWWCRPNNVVSAVPTYGRTDDTVHQEYLYAAKILGDSGVGTVDFGQDLQPRVAAAMGDNDPTASKCTFTFEIQNNTGAAFTPTVLLDTLDNFGNYDGSVTNRYAADASQGAVNNGEAKIYTVTIDTSGFVSALRNGAQLYVRIPSGSLDSNAKYVNFYNFKLEIGATATARYVDPQPTGAEDVQGTSTGTERDYLANGGFSDNRWGPNQACPAGVTTYVASNWFARPGAGSDLAYTQAADSPNVLTKYCAQLTGAPSVAGGVVDFGQELSAGNAVMLEQPLTFSIYVKNNTGAQFSPQLVISYPGGLNDWTFENIFVSQTLDACAIGVWQRLTYTFNGAGIPASNGLRIYLRFDVGVLGSGADSVRIAQGKLELGNLPTPFIPKPSFEAPGGLTAVSTNLRMSSTSTSALQFSFDGLTMSSGDGQLFYATAISVTGVSITTTGVNGLDTGIEAASNWYAIWAIGNGTVVRGLLSLSTTAPTLPAGYRFKALLGFVYNNASSDFVSFYQTGRRVYQTPQRLFSAKGPAASDTYEAISVPAGSSTLLGTFIPPAAVAARGTIASVNTTGFAAAFAADANGLGEHFAVNTSTTLALSSKAAGVSDSLTGPLSFIVPILTPQQFYWRMSTTSNLGRLEINGYEL